MISTLSVSAIEYCIEEVREDARLLRDEEAMKLAKQAAKELKSLLREAKKAAKIAPKKP